MYSVFNTISEYTYFYISKSRKNYDKDLNFVMKYNRR